MTSRSTTGPSGRRRARRTTEPAPPRERAPETEAEAEERARSILLNQLTAQARSRAQLAEKLAAKDVPDDVATRLLDRFTEVGLIDDEAFARAWVASRGPGKGLARRALSAELRRKGVADTDVWAALDEVDPDDEREAARTLVRRRLRSLRGVETPKATQRLVGMLARKGHPPGVAYAVVREVLAEDREDAADLPEDVSS
ncbi:regulatory protein RecX [Nocardioides sp. CFH 31398]|uniref:regulatory protein RecX n=1 Tax=Nocardioides sp. CFH 31398 TaxID=2919579 RepID=UPI001F06CBCD|nr:regulatory protein RecX [Nocardioides sp. CFH 31398]MCH1867505.1 recombination regulator RecX [Nocardioides sp. CFH 31398]